MPTQACPDPKADTRVPRTRFSKGKQRPSRAAGVSAPRAAAGTVPGEPAYQGASSCSVSTQIQPFSSAPGSQLPWGQVPEKLHVKG